MPESQPIHSVLTTLNIIEHMARANGPIGVSELARATGSTKPRIYRHLRTLVDQKYVTQDPVTEKYLLSLRLFYIGQSIAEKTEYLSEARRVLPGLRDRVRQTVTIGQTEDEGVRILDILRHRSDIQISTPPGALFDFHSSAQGKVALAFGPERLWARVDGHPLRQWTANTNTDLSRLKVEVDAVRRRGWAVAPEEVLMGINALAAPVRDASGALAGTIAIVGSIQHVTSEPDAQLLAAILDAAGQISNGLGYHESAVRP